MSYQLSAAKCLAAATRSGAAPSSLAPFDIEKGLFAGDAPPIAAQRPVGSHDPMARDDERNGIRGAGSGHGAGGRRTAHRGRDLPIGARLAVWDGLKLLPDLPLKRRGPDVDRQSDVRSAASKMIQQRSDLRAQKAIVAADDRLRVLAAEIALPAPDRGRQSSLDRRHGRWQPEAGGPAANLRSQNRSRRPALLDDTLPASCRGRDVIVRTAGCSSRIRHRRARV